MNCVLYLGKRNIYMRIIFEIITSFNCSSCDNNPTENIQNIFSQLEAKYRDKRLTLNDINLSEVNLRATLTLKLVYKFLENILKSEQKKYPDISVIKILLVFERNNIKNILF